MEIYLLRHCKTKQNINDLWSGCKTDIELSEPGITKSNELVNELSQIKFDIIFSSPLKRCLYTAKQLSKKTNTNLIIDDLLIERDFNTLEGEKCDPVDKIKLADFTLNTDLNNNVEKIQDMYYQRVIPFINNLLTKDYQRVLIITHSWIIRLFRFYLTGEKNPDIIKQTPINGNYDVFSLNQNNIISRSFNSFSIKDNKITKTSTYTTKFHDEIKWMVTIPTKLKQYIPHVYDYYISNNNSENDKSYLTMQYLDAKSYEQIYLNHNLTNKEVTSFFKQIYDFLNLTRQFVLEVNQNEIKNYLYDMYYTKTIDRINEIKDDIKFKNFYENQIIINHKTYHPIKYYLQKLEDTLLTTKVIDGKRKFRIIHGDLCFNNMIFKDNKMYLIDPRGSFGKHWIYGDQYYELAKIAHSISGYDNIINNFFELKIDHNHITYKILKLQNQKLFKNMFNELINKNILNQVYLIESLLFLSMIPLHSENYNHQILMLAFAIEKLNEFIK